MTQQQHLFLFTITPVQSFIAQARKTQDLYAASFFLSHLIDSAMNRLESSLSNKCEFIFPRKSIPSKPNRFIAKVQSDDIEETGKGLRGYVEKEFDKIAKSALDSLNISYEDKLREAFRKQIKDFLQVHWVSLSLAENDYANNYDKLECYLGAVKNVRVFGQLDETGRKCSLCGERNVLFYRLTDDEEKRGGLKLRKDGLLNKLYVKREDVKVFNANENMKIQKGEGLCAVCFVKRFAGEYFEGHYTKHFPSTAAIAAMNWLSNIADKEKRNYKAFFNNFDEQLYYEENLREEYLRRYGYFNGEKSLNDARTQLRMFYNIEDKNGNKIGKPPEYYALIMSDGDNMGEWFSGEFLEDEEKTNLKAFHKKVSEELGDYAKKADEEIRRPEGRLVYAGGDDVLAFVNLNHLFDVLIKLRKEFPKFEELGFAIKDNYKSTASAGIVIAHYKTPLSEVLKWARRMEHEAKEDGGRDAFAIAVLKRAGETAKTIWKWELDDKRESKKIKLLKNLVNELQDEMAGFSNTFIRNLNVELYKLGEIENPLLATELKRMLNRASQLKSDDDNKKRKIDEWQEKLSNLYIDSPHIKDIRREPNFLSFLNIADFLARRTK